MSSPTLVLAKPMLQEELPRGGRNYGIFTFLLGVAGLMSIFAVKWPLYAPDSNHHQNDSLDMWAHAPNVAARVSPTALKPWMASGVQQAPFRTINPGMSFGRVSQFAPRAANGGSRIVSRFDGDVEEKVKKMIAENLSVDEDKIKPETSFVDLGADSLDTVELLMAMEEEFGVEIPEEEAQKLTTVQAVIDYAKAKGS